MKLHMDVLKGSIESKNVELVKFMMIEIEQIEFIISANMDYKLVMKRLDSLRYSISVIDTVTQEVKDFGVREYFPTIHLQSTEIFLWIKQFLLNLFGTIMFDGWVKQELSRTKGRKKLAKLIVKYGNDISEKGVLLLLKENPDHWIVKTLLKPCLIRFCHGDLMSYEPLIV